MCIYCTLQKAGVFSCMIFHGKEYTVKFKYIFQEAETFSYMIFHGRE
jgi:hypothetical protein